jgi:lysophospholipase L1-like esterase
VRAFITGASLLVLGVLIGVLIGPDVRGQAEEGSRAGVVTHTAPATSSGSTKRPSPSGTGSINVPPTFATGTPSTVPGAAPAFNPSRPVTVGFGDSITFNPDSFFRQICTGGVVLENCLNAGIRGNTTTQMLTRIESDVLAYQPAVVIVMGGTNDLKRHESAKNILGRLDVMIDRIRSSGAVTVLCTVPPRNHYGKQVLALNNAIRGNVPLLDLYDPIGTARGVYKRGMTKDGIHPNLKASDLMTALAEQQLPALLHPIKESPVGGGRLSPGR